MLNILGANASRATAESIPMTSAAVRAWDSVVMAPSLSSAPMARDTSGVVAVAKKLKIKNAKLKTDEQTPSAARGAALSIRPT